MKAMMIDLKKGFDAMKGSKVVRHFDSYAEGWSYAQEHHLTLRYWALQPEAEAGVKGE
jgi:hypothetical protein